MMRHRTYTGALTQDISPREAAHRAIARRAAAEGFVLLKNEDNLLPLSKGRKLGLYGAGAVCTVKGGTGSGDVNERNSVNIWKGLEAVGFEITSTQWLEDFERQYIAARLDWRDRVLGRMDQGEEFFAAMFTEQLHFPEIKIDALQAASDGADTAVFVVRRIAGEGADRHDIPGDYYLTESEKELLAQVCAAYQNVVLIINTGGLMDLSFADAHSNIKAIIQFMQAGEEGGTALGDVLCGDVTPSGKLADTWAHRYEDYPSAATFSYKSGNVYREDYVEGIYVGYRYFDTFGIPVRHCFGFGLSYTQFQMEAGILRLSGLDTGKPRVSLDVTVTNTGSVYSGKEVAQVYVSCPQGKLPKELRRLAGFGKTRLLAPGESQTMTITFDAENLASYCEDSASWILEAGRYGVWLGNSLDSAKLVSSLVLDADAVVTKCRNICPRTQELTEIAPEPSMVAQRIEAWELEAQDLPSVCFKASDIVPHVITYSQLTDELPGKAGELVNSLSVDQLIALATGDPSAGQGSILGSAGQTVPGAAAETTTAAAMEPWSIASIVLTDGPAGLRLRQQYDVVDGRIPGGSFIESVEGGFFSRKKTSQGTTYYQYCTAIPVGTLLAQSWDVNLVQEIGAMIGHEMNEFETTLWLAPGMNIHRNPLCGRNFEYYSEDPLLCGMMATAMTLGVQSVPGCGTTIKHFACNNLEDNRMGSDSVISERALREIYLRGFEIAVKSAQPMSIMTSYNLINGIHAANCYDLCTAAARDEWGFAGAIMTDWTTTTNSTAGISTASGCMRAGNDMVMPGDLQDHENLRSELAAGTLDIRALKRCVYNTVRVILASNQYEQPKSWLLNFPNLEPCVKAE